MSNRAATIFGFSVAGVTLIWIAGEAPSAAITLAAVVALGVAVFHANEIATVLNTWSDVVRAGR